MPASSTLLPQYCLNGQEQLHLISAGQYCCFIPAARMFFGVPESDVPELLDTILATIKKGCSFQSSLFGILQQ